MNAYDKSYLEDAMHNLGAMCDCAVNNIGISETELWARFLVSGVAQGFGHGFADLVCGHSGSELALMVLQKTGMEIKDCNSVISISSPQYWAGWTLAYYNWASNYSFRDMSNAGIDLYSVSSMFNPLHEADLSVFVETANKVLEEYLEQNWLKKYRKLNELTQEELSKKSGVPIRLIRAYEQGTIDMNHAEYRTINSLAQSLGLI